MKKLLLLVPLLFATQPAFLDGTRLPPQFTLTFSSLITCEVAKPNPAVDNKLYYLETSPGGVRYMKSYFAQSVLIPGAPVRFKDTSVWWFVVPDPAHGNLYTARVYSVQRKEWALVAVNVGPLRRDLVARYYAYLPKQPASAPPTPVPVGNPPNAAVQWFFTSGSKEVPSTGDPGYFAMYVDRATYSPYRKPYSIVGGGSGAVHQAYGQLVYAALNLSPNLTPASFTPPSDYKQVDMSEKGVTKPGKATWSFNCPVCHETDQNENITLYLPVTKTEPCPQQK